MLQCSANLSIAVHMLFCCPPDRPPWRVDLHHAIVLRLNLEIAHNALIARYFPARTEEQS